MKKKPYWPRVKGALAPYAAGFQRELAREGYSPWTAAEHLCLMADLSRWLEEQDLGPADLDGARIEAFLSDRRRRGHRRWTTSRGLAPLLGYLRRSGVAPEPTAAVPVSPIERLLTEFTEHLRTERGLAAATIAGYRHVAELFLLNYAPEPEAEGCDLEHLGPGQVDSFVLDECARRSVGSAKNVVTALRVLMRFLYLEGYTAHSLVESVPRAIPWRDRGRSRALDPGDVRRLLHSCDRRSARGRRDFAILTVLSRLGLRAGEVASLGLEDVDWRAGEVFV